MAAKQHTTAAGEKALAMGKRLSAKTPLSRMDFLSAPNWWFAGARSGPVRAGCLWRRLSVVDFGIA
jgi:hypothetical protein